MRQAFFPGTRAHLDTPNSFSSARSMLAPIHIGGYQADVAADV